MREQGEGGGNEGGEKRWKKEKNKPSGKIGRVKGDGRSTLASKENGNSFKLCTHINVSVWR